jgi:hypothetical protein
MGGGTLSEDASRTTGIMEVPFIELGRETERSDRGLSAGGGT